MKPFLRVYYRDRSFKPKESILNEMGIIIMSIIQTTSSIEINRLPHLTLSINSEVSIPVIWVYMEVVNTDECPIHCCNTFSGTPSMIAFTAKVCLNLWGWILTPILFWIFFRYRSTTCLLIGKSNPVKS